MEVVRATEAWGMEAVVRATEAWGMEVVRATEAWQTEAWVWAMVGAPDRSAHIPRTDQLDRSTKAHRCSWNLAAPCIGRTGSSHGRGQGPRRMATVSASVSVSAWAW